jgi:hypothetical protein
MSFQAATKHILNDSGLYITKQSSDVPAAAAQPVRKLKPLRATRAIDSLKIGRGKSSLKSSDSLRKKRAIHPVAQSIYDRLLEAEKIERNIAKTSYRVRQNDYIHPNQFITQSKVSGLALYSIKKLKRQAKKQGFDFFYSDLSQQQSLSGFFSKMCVDLKFPKPRGGVRAHFDKYLRLFFKKINPDSQGVIIVLDNIKLKNDESNDLYFHIRDSLDKICEAWAKESKIIRIFCRVTYVFDEKKVVHLTPFS